MRRCSRANIECKNATPNETLSGTITARNTYGIGMDEILARDTGALFYHQDRIGNVSAVTNALGQVVEQYPWSDWGQVFAFNN